MNSSNLFEALDILFAAEITPNLHGHKGVGKTESISAYAKSRGYSLLSFKLGNLADQADLVGLFNLKLSEDGKRYVTEYARPSFFPTDPDAKVLLFLDEINRASPMLQQAVMELTLERRHLDYVMPPLCRVVAAQNPDTDEYEHQQSNDSAVLDRMCHLVYKPTIDEWVEHTVGRGADSTLTMFFKEFPEHLHGKMSEIVVPATPSPRKATQILTRIIPQSPSEGILREVVYGMLGATSGEPFLQYVKSLERPLSAKDVLENLPVHRERLARESSDVGGRPDALALTVDDVVRELKGLDGKVPEPSVDNLVEFLLTIPAGLMFNMLTSMRVAPNFYYEASNNSKFQPVIERAATTRQSNKLADLKSGKITQKEYDEWSNSVKMPTSDQTSSTEQLAESSEET